MSNEFLWVEKYRPRTVAETILPDELKQTFQKIVETGELPNMLFTVTSLNYLIVVIILGFSS